MVLWRLRYRLTLRDLVEMFLAEYSSESGELAALWPTSRQMSPKIRAFVNFLADRLDLNGGRASASRM